MWPTTMRIILVVALRTGEQEISMLPATAAILALAQRKQTRHGQRMSDYETQALDELRRWQEEMQRPPGLWNRATSGLQRKINSYIPEKVDTTVTTVIKQMTRAVLTGSNVTASEPL